jgi:hypothetical protein
VRLSLGAFDGQCGEDRPKLMLTGHSKGGGQAQFAAAKIKLDAIVFNSDIVNPVIADDALLTADTPWTDLVAAHSIAACRGEFASRLKSYSDYVRSGRIRDVRMVNDPVGQFFFSRCGNNLPHAPIEWLVDTHEAHCHPRFAIYSLGTGAQFT